MMTMKRPEWMQACRISVSIALLISVVACAPSGEVPVVASAKSAIELRTIQARTFDTADRVRVMRASISALQEMGYGIDRADASANTITATKIGINRILQMTVSAYPRATTQTVVRANATVRSMGVATQVDDPIFYRDLFFEPLSRQLLLAATVAPGREEEAPAPATPSATVNVTPVAPDARP